MEKNDKYGIETYGKERWENIVDNYNYNENSKSALFMKLAKDKNMNKVLKFISEILGIDNLELSWEIKKGISSPYIEVNSNNLAKDNNILGLAWDVFQVYSVNGWLGSNQSCTEYGKEDYYKDKATEFYYGIPLYFDNVNFDGGKNGSDIGVFMIYEDKIVYRLNKDYYKKDSYGCKICDKNAIITVPFNME